MVDNYKFDLRHKKYISVLCSFLFSFFINKSDRSNFVLEAAEKKKGEILDTEEDVYLSHPLIIRSE